MTYRKNRKQSLTIRLTDTEKSVLKRKAADARLSVTDYILLCVLHDEPKNRNDARLLMERLADLDRTLNQMKRKTVQPEYYDVLTMQSEIRSELARLARRA